MTAYTPMASYVWVTVSGKVEPLASTLPSPSKSSVQFNGSSFGSAPSSVKFTVSGTEPFVTSASIVGSGRRFGGGGDGGGAGGGGGGAGASSPPNPRHPDKGAPRRSARRTH